MDEAQLDRLQASAHFCLKDAPLGDSPSVGEVLTVVTNAFNQCATEKIPDAPPIALPCSDALKSITFPSRAVAWLFAQFALYCVYVGQDLTENIADAVYTLTTDRVMVDLVDAGKRAQMLNLFTQYEWMKDWTDADVGHGDISLNTVVIGATLLRSYIDHRGPAGSTVAWRNDVLTPAIAECSSLLNEEPRGIYQPRNGCYLVSAIQVMRSLRLSGAEWEAIDSAVQSAERNHQQELAKSEQQVKGTLASVDWQAKLLAAFKAARGSPDLRARSESALHQMIISLNMRTTEFHALHDDVQKKSKSDEVNAAMDLVNLQQRIVEMLPGLYRANDEELGRFIEPIAEWWKTAVKTTETRNLSDAWTEKTHRGNLEERARLKVGSELALFDLQEWKDVSALHSLKRNDLPTCDAFAKIKRAILYRYGVDEMTDDSYLVMADVAYLGHETPKDENYQRKSLLEKAVVALSEQKDAQAVCMHILTYLVHANCFFIAVSSEAGKQHYEAKNMQDQATAQLKPGRAIRALALGLNGLTAIKVPLKDLATLTVQDQKLELTSVLLHSSGRRNETVSITDTNGHYTARCKYGDHWYACNDSTVTDLEKQNFYDVGTQVPFLLMYVNGD